MHNTPRTLVKKRLIRNPILKFTVPIPFAYESPVTGFRDLDHPNLDLYIQIWDLKIQIRHLDVKIKG